MSPSYHYRLYELDITSEVVLPELARSEPNGSETGSEQVEIVIGTAPASLPDSFKTEDSFYEVNRTDMICTVPGIGIFHVASGKRILIQPDPSATANDVRTYLFGVAFAALVHQRGLLPLHISAIKTPTGVWAFTGDSGAGKSTLVGLLHKLTDWPLLCDDVAVVRMQDGVPMISAGLRRLKLWDDAVNMLGANKDQLVRDLERENKFHLKAPQMFQTEPMPLRALVTLERGESASLDPVEGARLFETVMNAIYRPYFVSTFGSNAEAAMACARIAGGLDGFVFSRKWSAETQEESARYLIDRISSDAFA